MTRIILSSSDFPESLSERQRFSHFQDLYSEKFSKTEIYAPTDLPFSASCVVTPLDGVAVMNYKGTIRGGFRTSKHIAMEAGEDAYHFNFNAGSMPWSFAQRGKELVATQTAPVFNHCTERMEIRTTGENAVVTLRLPRSPLLELIPNPDDHVLRPFDPTSEPLRYLRRYFKFLNSTDVTASDPAMIAHIRTTLLDLTALSLGANRDAADLARARGLRAARLREIVTHIQGCFPDPSFSAHHVAQRMGITPRYVQNILQETGFSFGERVIELRLQKARQMLVSPQYDHLNLGDIALQCGFNDASHYHKVFRHRFGCTPKEFRRQDS